MKSKGLLLYLLFSPLLLFSQSQPVISTPELSYSNDTLIIDYDIDNCIQGSSFLINLKLFRSDGSIINAAGLSGDIGENIECGRNKRIVWALANDKIHIDDEIGVEIYAEEIIVNKPAAAKHAKILKSSYSKGNIMLSSFALPGLGQKKVKGKSAYLGLGVIGYGSLAASGYMFVQSNNRYSDYLEATNSSDRDIFFKESGEFFELARYMAYGAAGIWTINIVWSAIMPAGKSNEMAVGILPSRTGGVELYARWNFKY